MTNHWQTRIQFLRGVAALIVVVGHIPIWGAPHAWINVLIPASFGVSIFFVLSGYIITRVHFKDLGHPRRLWHFIVKRLVRIYPAYWFFSAVTLFLFWAGYHTWGADPQSASGGDWLGSSLLVAVRNGQPIFTPVSWSLFHEMCFYAIFGVAIVSRPIGLLLGLAYLYHGYWGIPGVVSRPGACSFWAFFFASGVLAALAIPRLRLPRWLCHAAWVVGVMIAWGGSYYCFMNWFKPYLIGASLILWAVAALDTHYPMEAKSWIMKWGMGLGTISYSLYLCHPAVQRVLVSWIGKPEAWWQMVVYVLLPIGVAWLGYRGIEKPAMRWVSRRKTASTAKAV